VRRLVRNKSVTTRNDTGLRRPRTWVGVYVILNFFVWIVLRDQAAQLLSAANPGTKGNEADYVFITFILDQLPHGVIGLLVAAFFAAALSSKAAELNALGSSTTVDIYRQIRNRSPAARRSVTAPNG
jgi:Na+/proline symporter